MPFFHPTTIFMVYEQTGDVTAFNLYTKLDIYSIDEAFLDLTGMGDMEYLSSYCKQMVRNITKGTGIPISLGVAPTKTLAKMASKYAKKHKGYEGVCFIDTEEKTRKGIEAISC